MDKQPKLHHRRGNKVKLRGYIALTIVLTISALMVIIGVSVAIISINQGQMSTIEQKKEKVLDLTESCAAEALMKLNKTAAVPTNIVLPIGNCSIGSSNSGTNWTLNITGNTESFQKTIQISAQRTSKIFITSWIEI